MDTQILEENVNKHISITKEEMEYFIALFKSKKVKKKRILFEEGDIHLYAIFVTSGCLRSYAVDANGTEHILQFAPSGWWIGDMHSYLRDQPGLLYIDALEDSEILTIPKTDINSLYDTFPKFERYFRLLAERSLAAHQYRLVDNLSLSAMERYVNFCKLYPSLITRLQQKQIASYIGVTPEFLSKMLNQVPLK